MPRSFKIRASVKDPRVVMRAIIGTLLVANLAADSGKQAKRPVADFNRGQADSLVVPERVGSELLGIASAEPH